MTAERPLPITFPLHGTRLIEASAGTGKTFTMEGSDDHPGLVPRAMSRIFEDIADRTTNYQHDCFISMIEIYNEAIADLLDGTAAAAARWPAPRRRSRGARS